MKHTQRGREKANEKNRSEMKAFQKNRADQVIGSAHLRHFIRNRYFVAYAVNALLFFIMSMFIDDSK